MVQVVPVRSGLPGAAEKMQALLVPYSLTSFDLALDQYGELVAEMRSSCYYIIVLHEVQIGLFHEVH
jgi:hypothetical protein